jgi:hypothetical protein
MTEPDQVSCADPSNPEWQREQAIGGDSATLTLVVPGRGTSASKRSVGDIEGPAL